jgi:acyl transferase domain-containing protein
VFSHRRAVVGHSRDDVARRLAQGEGLGAETDGAERPVAFMFSGQGSHTRNMAGDLYLRHAGFRADIDKCARILEPLLGTDIRTVLYPAADGAAAEDRLSQTQFAQPALFVVQYVLARLWISWGVKPAAMIGHSLGEYVAACIAGVLSLPDALTLVSARGRLMQELPPGAMLSVRLPEDELRPILNRGLSIAAVNGPSMCVASGTADAVAVLERTLQERDVECRPLPVNRAFHSASTEAMLDPFRAELKRIRFGAPQIPFVSNVSGDWIRAEEATSPAYWTDHLRQTVRFGAGLETISRDASTILLEVAPSATLTTLTRVQFGPSRGPLVVSSLSPPHEERSAVESILRAVAKLWSCGVEIDWRGLHRPERRRRVPLPTYPFERHRCWIDGRRPPASDATATFRVDPSGVSVHPRPLIASGYEPPQSDLESRLVEIWQELLAIERIGMNDNFFELGGHSLLLTRLVERLRETFDVQLPLEEVFQRSTIRELADLITRCVLDSVEQLTDEEAQRLLQSALL